MYFYTHTYIHTIFTYRKRSIRKSNFFTQVHKPLLIVYLYAYVYVYVCMVCIRTYIYVCICICIYIYMYVCVCIGKDMPVHRGVLNIIDIPCITVNIALVWLKLNSTSNFEMSPGMYVCMYFIYIFPLIYVCYTLFVCMYVCMLYSLCRFNIRWKEGYYSRTTEKWR